MLPFGKFYGEIFEIICNLRPPNALCIYQVHTIMRHGIRILIGTFRRDLSSANNVIPLSNVICVIALFYSIAKAYELLSKMSASVSPEPKAQIWNPNTVNNKVKLTVQAIFENRRVSSYLYIRKKKSYWVWKVISFISYYANSSITICRKIVFGNKSSV